MVEVVGTGAEIAALEFRTWQASSSEVHSLAVTGPSNGILVSESSNVAIDQAWIHDTGDRGISVENMASVRLTNSLFERANGLGVFIGGSEATMDTIVVRNTQPGIGGTSAGIAIEYNTASQQRSNVMLRHSVLTHNHDVGVFVVASDATIEAVVVSETQPLSNGTGGAGIFVQEDVATQEPAALTLRTSLLDQNHDVGVSAISSDVTIDSTVVRATRPTSDGSFGRGIEFDWYPTAQKRTTLMMRTSLVEQNHEIGVN